MPIWRSCSSCQNYKSMTIIECLNKMHFFRCFCYCVNVLKMLAILSNAIVLCATGVFVWRRSQQQQRILITTSTLLAYRLHQVWKLFQVSKETNKTPEIRAKQFKIATSSDHSVPKRSNLQSTWECELAISSFSDQSVPRRSGLQSIWESELSIFSRSQYSVSRPGCMVTNKWTPSHHLLIPFHSKVPERFAIKTVFPETNSWALLATCNISLICPSLTRQVYRNRRSWTSFLKRFMTLWWWNQFVKSIPDLPRFNIIFCLSNSRITKFHPAMFKFNQ